jgi:hypothetical protein
LSAPFNVVEFFGLVGELEEIRLPIAAALVVPVAGDGHVHGEQPGPDDHECDRGDYRRSDGGVGSCRLQAGDPPQPQQARASEQQRIRRLRERRNPEQDRHRKIAAGREQPPGASRRALGRCDLFIKPTEVRQECQREIKQLGHDPDEIHRHDRGHDEAGGQDRGRPRTRARVQEQVATQKHQGQQARVQDQKTFRTEDEDERRRK